MYKRNLLAAVVGNIFEWYDFFVYVSLSAIIAVLFFPEYKEPHTALILTFTIFTVGYLTRPFGGVCLGHIGDRYGRRLVLVISMFLMASATLCLVLLPTYEQIGMWAPILLLFLRFIQGFAIGGEYPTLIIYLAEIAPKGRCAYTASFSGVTTVLGILCATLVTAILTTYFNEEQMHAFGSRLPFLLASIGMLFTGYLRVKLGESPIYQQAARSEHIAKLPLLYIIKKNKKAIGLTTLFIMGWSVITYTYMVFAITFLTMVTHDYSLSLKFTVFSYILLIILWPVAGHISDKVGHKSCAIFALYALIILSYPLFLLYTIGSLFAIIIAQIIFAVLMVAYSAPVPAILAKQSNTVTRCTTTTISYNIATLIGSATLTINLLLIHATGSLTAPAIYLSMVCIISLIAIYFLEDKVVA